jgi:hypothetical protein
MKFLILREFIDAKMKIFPQEAAEYFQLKAAVDAAKSRSDKTAAKLRLKEKTRELKLLYKELDRYRYEVHPSSNRISITYKKPAIQRTYAMLLDCDISPLNARLQIAHMLNSIDGMWIHSAKHYYTINTMNIVGFWHPTIEEVVSWPGLIGFPDPK